MWRYLLIKLIFPVLLVANIVIAQESASDCRASDEEFVSQLSTMKDWETIYSVYRANLPCFPDDGMYAEGYSDVIVRAFATQWEDIKILYTLASRNPEFRAFVLRHINATTDPIELEQALSNAESKCPAGIDTLCKEVAKEAVTALEEML